MADTSTITVPGPSHSLLNHLRAVFTHCKSASRSAFIAYTTLGFPSRAETIDVLLSLQAGGADIIECGVPFTDPMADGPIIQSANLIALNEGIISLSECLSLVKLARERGVTVPIVLMGYYNPFRSYSNDNNNNNSPNNDSESALRVLMSDCRSLGIAGFIIVDLPPEESELFRLIAKEYELSFIPLIAPTTTISRIHHLASIADSFIYAVSLTGITGTQNELSTELPAFIQRIREATNLPIAVGFGISNSIQFNQVSALSDGVVVGSAIIKSIINGGIPQLTEFCQNLTGRKQCTIVNPPTATNYNSTNIRSPLICSSNPTINNSTFGSFGGRYVPETLMAALEELENQYQLAKADPQFHAEVRSYWDYIGRPSRLHRADRLSEYSGGATIWLKREDLNHTGSHKINNAIAQAILAKRLNKQRIICETGAGQHGVATATICAKLGFPLTVYMGSEDIKRQELNVFRMKLLGAEVKSVESGSKTLKDAINEAMRDWVTNIRTTHYLIGSAIGPHPFPTIVRDFQSIIGIETKQQFQSLNNGKLPTAVVACVGGGSNAIGMFSPFQSDISVRLIGVEAGGTGLNSHHSATLTAGSIGVLHGTKTYLLQSSSGQISETHSISAGLDYPGVGPEHAHLKSIGRAEYVSVTDEQCLEGFQLLCQLEGIIPALESSHAIYHSIQLARSLPPSDHIIVCLSGRGDKDLNTVIQHLKEKKINNTNQN